MKKYKEFITAVFFGLMVALFVYGASQTVVYKPFLKIQNAIDDSHFIRRFLLRGNDDQETKRIVIVDIDDRSIESLGRFKYWPRRLFAEVLGNISQDGAQVIFLDVILKEGGLHRDNRVLADSVRTFGNVFTGYYFILDAPSIRQRPLDPVFNEELTSGMLYPESIGRNHFIKAEQIVLPYIDLLHSVRGFGFTNYVPDPDGVLRHIPLYIKYEKKLYPSASLMIWMHLNGLQSKNASITPEGLRFGDMIIPTDRHCFMRLNYTGSKSVYQTVSFVDVLERNFEPGTFNGKIIMIGSGSDELKDLKRIPGFSAIPGVEVHAAALTTLMSGRFLRVTPGNVILIMTVLCGMFSSVIFWYASPVRVGLPVVLGVPLVLFMYAVYCFIVQFLLVNISLPSFVIVLLYFVITTYRLIEGYENGKGEERTIGAE
ncbi:MAG: CHASE2 domain-containing protein [Candidatus Latescibacteria bacterium]|nr:CHASE2 domain-containing protein [Candidatus Latescibacterota bacterium]